MPGTERPNAGKSSAVKSLACPIPDCEPFPTTPVQVFLSDSAPDDALVCCSYPAAQRGIHDAKIYPTMS